MLRIKDGRCRLPSRRRPHYTAVERLRILEVKAARGWSREQVARIFLLDEETVRSWQGRVDEEGAGALVRMTEPVNKFPDFVRYLVRELKALLPAMGKLRIAQVLARAGLHLGATTVGRMLRETEPAPEESVASGEIEIVETRVCGSLADGDLVPEGEDPRPHRGAGADGGAKEHDGSGEDPALGRVVCSA